MEDKELQKQIESMIGIEIENNKEKTIEDEVKEILNIKLEDGEQININFLDAQRESLKNRDDVIKLKQDEIAKLQNEIAKKETKLSEMNMDYFRVVTNPDKLKVHTKLKNDLVNLKVKLEATKEELSLFQSTYKFEYDVNKIASELRNQVLDYKLQDRLEKIEAKLQGARKEAEELAADLFEYNSLITNAINTYKANVSDSNADVTIIEKAKEVIYKFHDSPVAYLVQKYPTYYYLPKKCIFKQVISYEE